jgi:hypothetical protein
VLIHRENQRADRISPANSAVESTLDERHNPSELVRSEPKTLSNFSPVTAISTEVVRHLTASEYPFNASADLITHSREFVSASNLHRRQIPRPDFFTILETISPCTDPARAQRIAQELHGYFQKQNIPITGLRLYVAKFIQELPIIEWREGLDIDVLAFCKVSEGSQPCSWLMHLGVRACLSNIQNWSRASIRWFVSDLEHLKEGVERFD